MFDFSWENIIASNTINFLFLAIVLGFLCIPKIKKIIQDSVQKTTDTINNSIKNKEQALNRLDYVKADYEKTPEETEEIRNIAKNTLDSLQRQALENLQQAKQTIIYNEEKSIKNEFAQITSELTKVTAENSIKSALKNITSKLKDDETLHDRLIEESINNLDVA
ncbi:MAG: hypothetical protein ACI37T_07615 [Candidatus Gastranaerophilaceae bacterium]